MCSPAGDSLASLSVAVRLDPLHLRRRVSVIWASSHRDIGRSKTGVCSSLSTLVTERGAPRGLLGLLGPKFWLESKDVTLDVSMLIGSSKLAITYCRNKGGLGSTVQKDMYFAVVHATIYSEPIYNGHSIRQPPLQYSQPL